MCERSAITGVYDSVLAYADVRLLELSVAARHESSACSHTVIMQKDAPHVPLLSGNSFLFVP
jgi:hypothetical protein